MGPQNPAPKGWSYFERLASTEGVFFEAGKTNLGAKTGSVTAFLRGSFSAGDRKEEDYGQYQIEPRKPIAGASVEGWLIADRKTADEFRKRRCAG